jgi:hypothetical protein
MRTAERASHAVALPEVAEGVRDLLAPARTTPVLSFEEAEVISATRGQPAGRPSCDRANLGRAGAAARTASGRAIARLDLGPARPETAPGWPSCGCAIPPAHGHWGAGDRTIETESAVARRMKTLIFFTES